MAGLHKAHFLCLIAIIGVAAAVNYKAPPQCEHEGHELHIHEDPNKYWYCDHKNATPRPMNCAPGRGFLRVPGKISGCVPWEQWGCTSKAGKPSCSGANYFKPHRHVNPNKFWACTEEEPGKPSVAVEADCLDFPVTNPPTKGQRGFVDNAKNLGCVPWNVWVCNEADNDGRE